MADFQTIKAQVSITQVLDMLDIKGLTPNGDTLRGHCPCCQEGNNRAFVVTPARNVFYCFSEKKGGSVIDLVARFKRIPESQAGQQIAAHFNLNGAAKPDDNPSPKQDTSSPSKSSGFEPLAYLQTLDAEHEALKALDILPETLIGFQAGYSSKGLNRGRLAVAWHDITGTIKAFVGVAINGELPMYLMPKGMQTPYWYGLHRVTPGGECRILPTVLDVLRASENGCDDCIAPLRPIDADALTCLKAFVADKNLTVEFCG